MVTFTSVPAASAGAAGTRLVTRATAAANRMNARLIVMVFPALINAAVSTTT
jgi:hypothetical protein